MSEENYRFRVIHRFTQNNFIPSQSQLSFNNGYFSFENKGLQSNWIILFNFNVTGAAPAAKQSLIDEMMLYYSGGASYSEGEKKDKVTHTMDNNGNVTSEPSK